LNCLTDSEARPGQCVGRLSVFTDKRRVVALFAGVLTLALQACPFADEWRDDYFEALASGRALGA